ncbi:MAG: VWA domain-containing protein [Planctomycetota bacterium]
MTFLALPAALLAAGLTVPVVTALYVLKLRRTPAAAPSTLLWAQAVHDLEANTPFQRFRNRLLFWLQLLALLLLLLAVARPALEGESAPKGRAVVVIDRSASMNTVDPGFTTTRLERAQARALELIDGLAEASGDGAAVLVFAESAEFQTDFTRDAGRLRGAVERVTPTDQRSRFDAVAALLGGMAEGGGPPITALVLSDGAFAPPAMRPGLAEVAWRYGRIGPEAESSGEASEGNLGVVGVSARRSVDEPERVEVLVSLVNTSTTAVSATLVLSIDGRPGAVATRSVDVPGAGDAQDADAEPGKASAIVRLTLPDTGVLRVAASPGGDLESDDTAWLVLPERRSLRVLAVGPGLGYARAAAEAIPGVRVEAMSIEAFGALGPADLVRNRQAGTGYDAALLGDGAFSSLPALPTLSFGVEVPVQGLRLVPPEAKGRASAWLDWDRGHPVLANLELADLTLYDPGRWVLPASAESLGVGLEGPVLAGVKDGGVRRLALSFALSQTDWPLYVSFPAFMDNALRWLTLDPGAAGRFVRTGVVSRFERAVGAGEESREVVWQGPERLASPPMGDGRGDLLFGPADRAGLYRAEPAEAVLPGDRVVAVNLCDAQESDNRAAASLVIAASAGTPGASTTAEVIGDSRRELWTWLVAAAIAVLCVEWLVYGLRSRASLA